MWRRRRYSSLRPSLPGPPPAPPVPEVPTELSELEPFLGGGGGGTRKRGLGGPLPAASADMVPRGSAAVARRRRQAREGPVTERGARPAAAAVAAATEEGPKGSSRRSWEAGPAGWIPGQRVHPSCSGEQGSWADMEHREQTRGAGLEWRTARKKKARAPGRPPSGEAPVARRLQLPPAMERERGRPGCGKGVERGRDARRKRGAGPHASKAAALSHSFPSGRGPGRPRARKGVRGAQPRLTRAPMAAAASPPPGRRSHRPRGRAALPPTAAAASRGAGNPPPPSSYPPATAPAAAAHSRRSPRLPLPGAAAEPSPGGARRAGPSAAARRRLGTKWRRREPEPTHGPGGRRGRAAGHAPAESA